MLWHSSASGRFTWAYKLLVHAVASWTYKPIEPKLNPTFTSKDVTVVLPTIGVDNDDLHRCLQSIDANNPASFVIVTPEHNVSRIGKICEFLGLKNIRVLGAPQANKRLQMIQGIEAVQTPIVVFADDDVFWPTTFLTYLLAPFEDPRVGAVGPFQSLERPKNPNAWDFLSAGYLERWNFGIAATSHIDGGIQCLSGRTQAVRIEILQQEAFLDAFANETWFFGKISLTKADDDNCLTRWLVNHGWKIKIQCAPESRLTTTLERSSAFLGQCIRWYRTTWRSNITSMLVDRTIWRAQPWSSYALHLSTFNPPAAILESVLAYLLYHSYDEPKTAAFLPARATSMAWLVMWVLLSKTVKLWPHFCRYPADLKFLPVMFAFGYFHGLIKVWTLLTIHKTTWDGSRTCLIDFTAKASTAAVNLATNAKDNSALLLRSSYDGTRKKLGSATDLKRLGMRSTQDLTRLGMRSTKDLRRIDMKREDSL
ncbi:MAG: hypothetical protein Q9167_005149 [Letrouitia subvulpina]